MPSPQEVQDLIYKYRATPQLFDDTQIDELEKLAEQYQITFNPQRNNTSLGKVMKQAVSGVFEGFTTIPVGDKPKNTYESIAHSMGHLIGFAPGILFKPIGLVGKGAKALKLTKTAEALESTAKGAQTLNKFSVPMIGGKYAKDLQSSIIRRSGLESAGFLRRGGFSRSVVDEAQHLAAASTVSSIWQGPDAWMDAYMGGAIAGGAFATLGEMKLVSNNLKRTDPKYYRKGEQQLKGIIGSAMLGMPAYLRGDPIESVMYETLLGGFFGYNSRPAAEAIGGKFVSDLKYGEAPNAIFKPEDVAGFKTLHHNAKDYIYKHSNTEAYNYYYRNMDSLGYDISQVDATIYRKAQKKYRTEAPSEQQLQTTLRELANDLYTSKTGYVYADAEVYNKNMHNVNKMDPTDQVELDVSRKEGQSATKIDEMKAREKEKPIYVMHKNEQSDVVEVRPSQGSVNGKKHGDKYVDRPTEKLESTVENDPNYGYLEKIAQHQEIKINEFGVKTVEGEFVDFKPFDYKLSKDKFGNTIIEDKMSKRDWWNLENNLDNQGLYVFGGIKDKGILSLRKYHKDVDALSAEALVDALVADANIADPAKRQVVKDRIRKNYIESLKEYKNLVHEKGLSDKDVVDLHEKQWKSNILVEAERNGLYTAGSTNDLSQIHKLMRTDKQGTEYEGGYSRNVTDWNKREQLYHDKSMPFPAGVINRKLKFGIANDAKIEQYLNESGETKDYESNTDGTIVVRESIFKQIMEGVGLPKGTSMNKPVIVAKIPGYGTIAIKSAARSAKTNSPLEVFMGNHAMDMLFFKSSAKHMGDIKPFDLVWNKAEGKYEMGPNNEKARILELDPTDIRLNLSTYENPNVATKGMFIPRQMLGNLSLIKHGNAAEIMWDKHYEPAINGDKDVNSKVIDYISGKDINIKDIKVDDVGVENIIRILREKPDSELARSLSRQMARMDKAGELESYSDLNTSEYEQYIFRNNRILDNANFNEGSKIAGRLGKKFWQDTYKKYMINRYIRPKYKYSSKAWLAPVYEHQASEIKTGTFKLDRGQGKMKVVDINGKETTLAEAYKKGTLDLDSFLLIRVPADSPSGVRGLKFAGFTDSKGYSIKTNAKDDMYLGGADKDSDSVFIFQGMDKQVINAFKKDATQWEKNGRVSEAKSEKYDKDFNAEKDPRLQDPESKFSPSFRRLVAKGVYRGQQGLGPGLTAKQALTNMADMVHKAGGKLDFIYTYPEGHPKAGQQEMLFLEVGDSKALDVYGREIVNRSADAADNPNMIDFLKVPELLWSKGKFRVTDANGNPVSMNYAKLKKNSSLGRVHRIYQEMNPKARIEGRNKTLNEWIRDIQRNVTNEQTGEFVVEDHGVKNLFNLAAKKMHDTKFLEIETINMHDIAALGSNLRSRVNKLAKSPNELQFIQKELSKITNINLFGKDLQLAYEALVKSNFEPTTYKVEYIDRNTGKKKSFDKKVDIETVNDLITKDILYVAHYNALAKKALKIRRKLKEQGVENADQVVEQLLLPIQTRINNIKQRYVNRRFTGGRDLNKTIDTELDNLIMNDKEIGWKGFDKDTPSLYSVEKSNGLEKRNDKGEIIPGLLQEYYDLYMLSPFMEQPSPMFSKDRRAEIMKLPKEERNMLLYPEWRGHASKWQSKSVSDGSIKEVTNEFNDLYQSMKQGRVEEVPLVSDTKNISYDNISSNHKVQTVTETAVQNVKKAEPKKQKSKETLEQFLNRKAITDTDVKEIKLFQKNLKENPNLADNFDAFFTTFTMQKEGVPRDSSTMSIFDIYNVNRYMKDYDRRYKKRGKALKPSDWYIDPRTVSEHHAMIEGKVFASYEMPVKTSDGIVRKKVKMFTSTQGELQETFATLRQHVDKEIASVQQDNLNKYDFRNTTTPKDRDALHEMMVDYVEGVDYKQNKLYKEYANKKHKANNREMTTDELVEFYGEKTKKDLVEFGNKWIYAKDKSGVRIEFNAIDKDGKYGEYNEFLKWKKDGKFDFGHYLRNSMPDSISMKEVPIENSYRFHYEMVMEKYLTEKGFTGSKRIKERKKFRANKNTSFNKYMIGEREMYFPHLNFGATKGARAEIEAWLKPKLDKVYNDAINEGKTKEQAQKARDIAEAEARLFVEGSASSSGLGEKAAIDAMMHNAKTDSELNNTGIFSRPQSLEHRIADMPGWDKSANALDIYKERIINSAYKSVAVSKTQTLLDKFKQDRKFGEHTDAWADFLTIYTRDAFGHKSTFPQRIQEAMERGKDPIAVKNTLYRGFSDTQAIKSYKWFEKKLGKYMPYKKKVPDNPYDKIKEPKKWAEAEQARNEAISRIVHDLGAMEAKFNLITLLSTPKVMVGNLFGGTQMTFNQSGFRAYKQAMDFTHVEKTLLKNRQGNWILKRKDSKGNEVFVKTKKDLKKWLVQEGIIDSYIQGELQYNQKLNEAIGQRGRAGKQFVRELTDLLRKNPDATPMTIIELGKKYGIDKKVLNASGFFMQMSERKARYDAFLSSAIKWRNMYGKHGADMNLSDPAMIKAGMKGIEASQFLYHTAFRAPFMRTATGKVMTRFKHFVFQSTRARKEFYRQAKHYGFKEGTEPYEKFKRMFVTDMMITALGTLFAYSLFDTSTPPPYDFFTSLSDLLFGDKKERDRAFFGTLPRPVAPLQYGLPPIARVPINTITPLINDDWDRFWDYHVHTMYPFGRLARSVDKTIDEPYGTTFGRFTQQFAGIPVDKIKGKIDKNTMLKERKRIIDERLDSSYNIQ